MDHACDSHPSAKSGGYGPAIEDCREVDKYDERFPQYLVGELWSGNGEYDSQVNYCPFCGYEAKVQIKESKNADIKSQ